MPKPLQRQSHSHNIAAEKLTTALRQVVSASPEQVRAASAAAKAEKFSSHTRFVPRPAKAS
jgi:hypothetical protein